MKERKEKYYKKETHGQAFGSVWIYHYTHTHSK